MLRVGQTTRLISCSLALVLAVLGFAPTVHAGSVPTSIPLSSFAEMAVDGQSQTVFVSGGPGTSSVFALGYDGSVKRRINGFLGPTGMVIVGTSLYIANQDGGTISVVDTTTLTPTGTIDLGSFEGPKSLGYSSGLLWSLNCDNGSLVALISIDLETDLVVDHTSDDEMTTTCSGISSIPGSDSFLVWEKDAGPSSVYRYSYQPATLLGAGRIVREEAVRTDAYGIRQLSVSPDGERFIYVSGYPYHVEERSISDLTMTMIYPASHYPAATVYSPDGQFLAAGIRPSYPHPDVWIWEKGNNEARTTVQFSRGEIAPAGLAFSHDGKLLFVVKTLDDVIALHILDATRKTTGLSLRTTRDQVRFGRSIRLTVRLHGVSTTSNRKVTFLAKPRGQKEREIGEASLDAGLTASVTVFPQRATRYRAVWRGDKDHAAAETFGFTAEVFSIVRTRMIAAYGKTGIYKLFHRGGDGRYVAWIEPRHRRGDVGFWLQVKRGAWRHAANGSVPLAGKPGVAIGIGRGLPNGLYRMRANFSDWDHVYAHSKWSYFQITD